MQMTQVQFDISCFVNHNLFACELMQLYLTSFAFPPRSQTSGFFYKSLPAHDSLQYLHT